MTEKPISPADARNLMPSRAFADAVKKLNDSIKSAAKNDKNSVRIDWLCNITGDKCTLTPLGVIVTSAFEKEGYKIRDIYVCRQFVDVGMELTWSATE